DMSNQVMDLINRDESRHIAMDYYMMEYYASDEYQEKAKHLPKKSAIELAKAGWAFGNLLLYARPFLYAVFLNPMEILDPEGKRMKEAFKRMQLLQNKETIAHRPFPRFLVALRKAYNTPVIGDIFGEVIS